MTHATWSKDRKGGNTAIAHKRRIEHLFIVAGVPTSGKTTLIQRLVSGELGAIADEIGFEADKDWVVQHFKKIGDADTDSPANILLHYNITQHLIDGDVYRHDRSLLDLIRVASRVTVVSLWCSPEELARRYNAERAGTVVQRYLSRPHKKKKRILRSLFEKEDATIELFADWFNFVKRNVRNAHVIVQEDQNRVIDIEQWKGLYRA
ncbi:MAG: hypothetical protein IID49_01315 [Proteobacteria bacterium]|nr:hypothetical protein [Pseudomonadota bacterium]